MKNINTEYITSYARLMFSLYRGDATTPYNFQLREIKIITGPYNRIFGALASISHGMELLRVILKLLTYNRGVLPQKIPAIRTDVARGAKGAMPPPNF